MKMNNENVRPLEQAMRIKKLELERENRKKQIKNTVCMSLCALSGIGGIVAHGTFNKMLILGVGLFLLASLASNEH